MRIMLRLAPLPLLAALVVWDSATDPIPLLRWFLLFLSAFIVVPLTLFSYWNIKGEPVKVPKWTRVVAPITWLLSVTLIVSVIKTEWPFLLSFRAMKSQFERLAVQSRADKPVKLPQSVGWLNVTDVYSDYRGTLIYLNDAGSGSGPMLFLPARRYAQRDRAEYKRDSEYIALGDDWYLLAPFD